MVKIATVISFFFLSISVLLLEEESKKISLNSLNPNFRSKGLDFYKTGEGVLVLDTIQDSRGLLMDSGFVGFQYVEFPIENFSGLPCRN